MKKLLHLFWLGSFCGVANASLVTYDFSFTATAPNNETPAQGSAFLGSTIMGSFSYETQTSPFSGTSVQYNLSSYTADLSGTTLYTGVSNTQGNQTSRIRVYDDVWAGQTDLLSISGTLNQNYGDYNLQAVGMVFYSNSDTAITSNDLTTDIFTNFNPRVGRIFFSDLGDPYSGYYVEGELTLTQTPLPPAVWLFGSGVLGLVGLARRRR